jgi:hypothetical protein
VSLYIYVYTHASPDELVVGVGWDWVSWYCGHSWPIVPASGDSEEDCGEADGRGNRSSRRKRAPAPLLSITKSHMTRPGFEPEPPRWEAGDYYFFYLVCEAFGTEATPSLLCQPRVIVNWRWLWRSWWNVDWQGHKPKFLGGNLPQRHFCPSQNPTWPDPGLNPGRRGGKPATNRLSYGAAVTI